MACLQERERDMAYLDEVQRQGLHYIKEATWEVPGPWSEKFPSVKNQYLPLSSLPSKRLEMGPEKFCRKNLENDGQTLVSTDGIRSRLEAPQARSNTFRQNLSKIGFDPI